MFKTKAELKPSKKPSPDSNGDERRLSRVKTLLSTLLLTDEPSKSTIGTPQPHCCCSARVDQIAADK